MTNVALVTGASSGIGWELASQLAARGHDLAIAARRVDRLEELATDLHARHGVAVSTFQADLSEPRSGLALHEDITSAGLRVDYLVNNAGATLEGRYLDYTAEQQRGAINLLGVAPAELMHACLPSMVDAGRGHILNISSLGAYWPCFPGVTVYAAGKWMLVNLTRTLAAEYGRTGVKFSCCVPFTTDTAFLDTPTNREIVGRMPRRMIQSPRAVARIALDGVEAGRVVQHTSGINRALAVVLKSLPGGLVGKALVNYMSIGRDDL